MTQRIQVQGGKIVFSATDSDNVTPPAVDMIVEGEITVGTDDLANGQITSSLNQDLILESPGSGNIRFDSNLGSVFINNAKWPTVPPASSGSFLSSGTSLEPGNLEFLPFILGTQSSDTLTQFELDNLYPDARIGQQVIGPTVVYQCVNPAQWRTLSGGTNGPGPNCLPCPPNSVGLVYASPSADYQILSTDGWPAIVGLSSSGFPDLIQSDTSNGWVLTSNGSGTTPSFQPPSSSSLITIKDVLTLPYTLSPGDELNVMLRVLSSSSGDIFIPDDFTYEFPVGTNILISQSGTGAVTIVSGLGVIVNTPDTTTIGTRYGKVTIIKVAANEWDIEGNLLLS